MRNPLLWCALRWCALVSVHLVAVTLVGGTALGACSQAQGDTNGDGAKTIVDVQCMIIESLHVLGGSSGPPPTCVDPAQRLNCALDLNCDGSTDIGDITLTIGRVLGTPLSAEVDSNLDDCPDACESTCGDTYCEADELCGGCEIDCGPDALECCINPELGGCEAKLCVDCACRTAPLLSLLLPEGPTGEGIPHDPELDEPGGPAPAGTVFQWPTDPGFEATKAALFEVGGSLSFEYDNSRNGQLFNVRTRIAAEAVEPGVAGGEVATIDLGAVTVSVSNGVAGPGGGGGDVELLALGANLEDLFVLKTYSRPMGSDGSLGPVQLDYVSVWNDSDVSAGPLDAFDIANLPDVSTAGDCDALAWEGAVNVPPMAVSFPPLIDCDLEQCVTVKLAWIRAHHDLWRLRQMIDFFVGADEELKQWWWYQVGKDELGQPLGEDTSLAFYFGDYAPYRFDAIRWVLNREWEDMHDHDLAGISLRFDCAPFAGNICKTTSSPAHHAVKGQVFICAEFYTQPASYQPLIVIHELLHHLFVPWQNTTPRLDPLLDLHTHFHGSTCAGSPITNKGYGIDEVRHLATYTAGDGGSCFHRNFAFRNNDTYGYAVRNIGRFVRQGIIKQWPHRVFPPTWEPSLPPNIEPCSNEGLNPPPPGDDYFDPLNDCEKLGGELVCPSLGGGGGVNAPKLDLKENCPEQ